MEWPWPPHLLAESSFSKEIRKMLQPSITDFLSVENSNSSSFQLGQISRIQGKEIPSACIHLDRSLQSVILLYEGSFGWKCISTWLAKKKFNFDGTGIFRVLSLHLTIKTEDKSSWSYHMHTQAQILQCQTPVTSTHTHWFPQTLTPRISRHGSKHKGSKYTPSI